MPVLDIALQQHLGLCELACLLYIVIVALLLDIVIQVMAVNTYRTRYVQWAFDYSDYLQRLGQGTKCRKQLLRYAGQAVSAHGMLLKRFGA